MLALGLAASNGGTSEVIAVLRQDLAASQATSVAQLVETRILPLFDFQHTTRMAVARNWRLASAEQQATLVAQFRRLLVRTYSSALSSYRDQDIEYKAFAPRARRNGRAGEIRGAPARRGNAEHRLRHGEHRGRLEGLRREGRRGQPGHDLSLQLRGNGPGRRY